MTSLQHFNCIIVINNRNFIEEEELVKLWRKWWATQNLVFITQWSTRRLQDYEKSSSRKYERLWFLFTTENSTWTSSTGTERLEEPVRVDEVDIWSWSSFGFSIFWKTTKYGYEILTSKRPIFVYSHLWNIYIVLSTDLHVLSVKSDALRVRYEKGWLDLDINIHFLQFRQAHTPDLSFSNGEYLFPKCATRLVT